MIKKHQRWIALLVTLTFMWLLQVSTMPLAAAGTSEQVSSASVEQGPDYYEAIAQKAAPAKKKSILPIVLIGVGLVAVTAAVLFLFVLNKYDITGTWDFVFTHGGGTEEFTTMFAGTRKSGTWSFVEDHDYYGTYSVDGKKFTTTITSPAIATQFNGEFTAKDTMTGTWVIYGNTWNWTATRKATTSSAQPSPARIKPFSK
jgi:uncharacterized membrane protein